MRLSHYLSVFVTAAIITSCVKQGPIGPQGPAGGNGSANVTVQTYTVTSNEWISNGNGGWNANLASSIDPTQGAVSILYSDDNAAHWLGLPYVGNVTGDADINYVISSSAIQIQYVPQTGAPSIVAPANTVFIQASLVPPVIQAIHPNINWKNANEVAQLPEVQAAKSPVK
jgi:hypothetical protein